MSDVPPKLTVETSSPKARVITKESLIGLGAAHLAQLVLDGAASDSKLLENVRRKMAQPPRFFVLFFPPEAGRAEARVADHRHAIGKGHSHPRSDVNAEARVHSSPRRKRSLI